MDTTDRMKATDHSALFEVDRALRSDREERRRQAEAAAPQQQAGPWPGGLPALLRLSGALVLITAATVFMLQQWEVFNHVQRYYSFLAFTFVLTAAGFFCGLRMQDDKSARTFLLVTAAIVPVHFTQLGALLFSRFGTLASHYPSWLYWQAPDTATALTTTGIGLFVLTPLVYIAFSALARSRAAVLTAAYLGVNSVLLIPVRDPNTIGLLSFILLGLTVLFDIFKLQGRGALRTFEGSLVRTMLYVPCVLLVARTLHLYSMSFVLAGALLESAAVGLFFAVPHAAESRQNALISQVFGCISAVCGWFLLTAEIAETWVIGDQAIIPLSMLPAAAIIAGAGRFSIGSGRNYYRVAAFVAVGSIAFQLLSFGGALNASICIAVGIAAAGYGHLIRQQSVFLSGAAAFILGILCELYYALSTGSVFPWLILAATGTASVLAAAYAERHPQPAGSVQLQEGVEE